MTHSINVGDSVLFTSNRGSEYEVCKVVRVTKSMFVIDKELTNGRTASYRFNLNTSSRWVGSDQPYVAYHESYKAGKHDTDRFCMVYADETIIRCKLAMLRARRKTASLKWFRNLIDEEIAKLESQLESQRTHAWGALLTYGLVVICLLIAATAQAQTREDINNVQIIMRTWEQADLLERHMRGGTEARVAQMNEAIRRQREPLALKEAKRRLQIMHNVIEKRSEEVLEVIDKVNRGETITIEENKLYEAEQAKMKQYHELIKRRVEKHSHDRLYRAIHCDIVKLDLRLHRTLATESNDPEDRAYYLAQAKQIEADFQEWKEMVEEKYGKNSR